MGHAHGDDRLGDDVLCVLSGTPPLDVGEHLVPRARPAEHPQLAEAGGNPVFVGRARGQYRIGPSPGYSLAGLDCRCPGPPLDLVIDGGEEMSGVTQEAPEREVRASCRLPCGWSLGDGETVRGSPITDPARLAPEPGCL